MEEYIEVLDKEIVNEDLNNFWLQAGFVEGIIADGKSFSSLEKAYQHIFRRNKEYAIVLINAIPVRWSYIEDIPFMIDGIVHLLNNISTIETSKDFDIKFETANFSTSWKVNCDKEIIEIDMFWTQVAGNYEEALNLLSNIKMKRVAFLYEWKLLLEQLVKSMEDSEANITNSKELQVFNELRNLNHRIKKRGRFYRTEEE